MTTLSAANPTLLDVANRIGPDGKIVKDIIELLAETNEVLADATWIECNDGTGHKTTVRTGLPSPTWRKLYGGVAETKSTTVQVRDACGMEEAYSTIDAALAPLAGQAEWRMSEELSFIEAMNQGVADTLFYGDTTTTPEKFMGISPRFDSLSAENAANIISGGSNDTDNTSIYLVCWHPLTCTMLYPKGSQAGLQVRDLGEQTVYDASSNPFQALRTHYKWHCGLSVRDWRYVVRIPNIEVSDLVKDASSGADLVDLMVQALELLPGNAGMGRKAFYCNRTVRSYLRRQIKNKANLALSLDQVAGKQVLNFDGIPVRRCDSITNAEALVS
jgi:hypothetical protein